MLLQGLKVHAHIPENTHRDDINVVKFSLAVVIEIGKVYERIFSFHFVCSCYQISRQSGKNIQFYDEIVLKKMSIKIRSMLRKINLFSIWQSTIYGACFFGNFHRETLYIFGEIISSLL